jgi:hypothetical protein
MEHLLAQVLPPDDSALQLLCEDISWPKVSAKAPK